MANDILVLYYSRTGKVAQLARLGLRAKEFDVFAHRCLDLVVVG